MLLMQTASTTGVKVDNKRDMAEGGTVSGVPAATEDESPASEKTGAKDGDR